MSETAIPPSADDSPTSDVYHTALVRALILQAFFVLFASLILDFGIFRAKFCVLSVGYWIGAVAILIFRPGAWGLRYLRHGVLATFPLGVIADSIWREKILDLVRG